jgi:hypothetical protein
MAAIRIGISGWRYAPWRGTSYPEELPQHAELKYAAGILSVIEINGSFYSLQRPPSYARCYADTPEGFVFTVKGPALHHPHAPAARIVELPTPWFVGCRRISWLFRINKLRGPPSPKFSPRPAEPRQEVIQPYAGALPV